MVVLEVQGVLVTKTGFLTVRHLSVSTQGVTVIITA